jgi:hypothetical protein
MINIVDPFFLYHTDWIMTKTMSRYCPFKCSPTCRALLTLFFSGCALKCKDFDFFEKMKNADLVMAAEIKGTFIKGNLNFFELLRPH